MTELASIRSFTDPSAVPRIPELRWMGMLERRLSDRMIDPRRVAKGLRDLLLIGAAYAVAILLLAVGGVGPGMKPWLNIPAETYFYWEVPFAPLVIFLSGLLASAVMQLLARWLGGAGTFEDTLALIGPVTAWATLTTLIPDAVIGILLILGVIDAQQWMTDIVRPSPTLAMIWAYLLLYLVAFLWLYPKVARMAHGLQGWRARACGWIAFLVYQGVLIIFIR